MKTARRPLLALTATTLLLGACTAFGPPTTATYAPPAAGSTWELSQRNTGSYGRDAKVQMRSGETSWQGQRVLTFTNAAGATTLARPESGRWIAMLAPDGKPAFSFNPPLGWDHPLYVGKAWTDRYRMTVHATNRTIEYDLSCKVEAWEKVTVPAGTFDAYRIGCKSSIGNEEVYWTSPALGVFIKTRLTRLPGNPFGAGTQEAELTAQAIRK